jgi:hypothetical protein
LHTTATSGYKNQFHACDEGFFSEQVSFFIVWPTMVEV